MTRRDRIITALVACAVNLALFAPTVGDSSTLIDGDFGPEAFAIEDGAKPYADQDLEYPPLSIPLIVGPALIGDGIGDYRDAFEWEMIAFDLAIVLTLALAMSGPRERVWGALGVYTIGLLALSGIVLPDSDIEAAPLALARFDLAPALLVLAAVLAREANRSATWSFLLSLGVAVKGFPAALYPPLLRAERNPGRVALAALPPLLAAVALVVAFGDEFGSAITYHSGRDLQIETVAATPFELGHLFGLRAEAVTGAGSYNLDASGAAAARLDLPGLDGRRLHLAALGRLAAPHATAAARPRPAGGDRRLRPGALAPVPDLAAPPLGRRLRPRQGEPDSARRLRPDAADAARLRHRDRRPRRRLHGADGHPQPAAARLPLSGLRPRSRPRAPTVASMEGNGEFELIEQLVARLPRPSQAVRVGSGDDAAVVEARAATATTIDVVVEGIHFTLPAFPLEAVGRKALAASLSDLAAMGAEPGEAYVALVCPPRLETEALLRVADGLAAVAEREGVSVIGGDVSRGPVLTLAVTSVGREPADGRLVERRGALPGDAVAVTGELGGAAAALALLDGLEPRGLAEDEAAAIRARQLDPTARLVAGRALAAVGARAMIDISDGLGADALHLARAGQVRLEIDLDAVPVQTGVAAVAGSEEAARELAASGGEDYELLACLPPDRVSEAGGSLQSAGCRLTVIGEVCAGSGVSLRDSSGRELEPGGFDHLRD